MARAVRQHRRAVHLARRCGRNVSAFATRLRTPLRLFGGLLIAGPIRRQDVRRDLSLVGHDAGERSRSQYGFWESCDATAYNAEKRITARPIARIPSVNMPACVNFGTPSYYIRIQTDQTNRKLQARMASRKSAMSIGRLMASVM